MMPCWRYIKEVMPQMDSEGSLHPYAEIRRQFRTRRYRLELRRGYWELGKNILLMAVILWIAFTQVFSLTTAQGTDMYPAILHGDVLLGYRLENSFAKNDVVVATVDGKEVIGRVVAVAGDSLEITEDGNLYVNGTRQTGEIAFPTQAREGQTYPITVPEGCVYLLGDYRTNTTDSRDYGPVEVKGIKAKVVTILRRRGI